MPEQTTEARHRGWLEAATIEVSSAAELEQVRPTLLRNLERFQVARITGLVRPQEMRAVLEQMSCDLDVSKDRATTGESPDEVRRNFQKLSIGRACHGKVDRPRFMRVFYNPLSTEDSYGMHSAFERVVAVRNSLMGKAATFAIRSDEGGMWTAARMHQFPSGGGFMVAHRDTVLPALVQELELGAFFQPVLLVTQMGVDFQTGGGFAEVHGEKVEYEKYCQQGDIVIYDSRTLHGVDDVDVHVPYRQDSMAGRISALVTLYKTL